MWVEKGMWEPKSILNEPIVAVQGVGMAMVVRHRKEQPNSRRFRTGFSGLRF
jgi:hypothetical protein